MLEQLKLFWHRWQTRRKMNRVFGRGRDPYDYASNPYEVARLEGMLKALGSELGSVLEIGAAEGFFTRRLVESGRQVTSLELSPVALARAQEAAPGAQLIEADVRTWEPGRTFNAVVCGDVLYYMDKPMVREEFAAVFPRIASWVTRGGLLMLAHGFAGEREREIRQGYRERFEKLGFTLEDEHVVGEAKQDGDVCCLISVLRRD
jgi:SAM-dependent methyltransferase